MSQFSFRAALVIVVLVSFAVLVARGRPLARFGLIEPLLYATGLHQPRGLLFRQDGTLLIAEAGGNDAAGAPIPGRVTIIGPTGEVTATVADASGPATATDLWSTTGPSAISAGTIGQEPVVLAGPAQSGQPGRLLRVVGEVPDLRLDPMLLLPVSSTPWGATTGPDGALYFTVPAANQLLRATSNPLPGEGPLVTSVTGFVGTDGSNLLPTGIAFGPDGALYVALFATTPGEAGSGKVVRVEPDGR
ncbi:MAG TPA: hypothetical protein VGW38_09150, partial [Chloroflexota bacterium]|nr:hypothetical protein [Chloroflexota bacterium]